MALYTTTNRKLNEILKSNKNASFTVGLVTLFVVVLMLFLAILPAYKSITDQIQNNQAKTEYIAKLKEKRSILDKLTLEYDANSELIKQFDEDYPQKQNNEFILATISKIGTLYNVEVSSISFTNKAKSNQLETLPPSLAIIETNIFLKGKLPDLEKFVAHLEKYPIPLNYSNLDYHYLAEKIEGTVIPQSVPFVMTLNFEYYYFTIPTN